MRALFTLIISMILINMSSGQIINKYLIRYVNLFRPGTITLKTGQTLHGDIKYYYYGDKVLFKGSDGNGRQEYFSTEVKSFEFDGKEFKSVENFFVTKSVNPHKFVESGFVEILAEGKVNLYFYSTTVPYIPTLQQNAKPVFEIGFLLSKNSENESYFTNVPVDNKGDFNKQMSQYFVGNDFLSSQLAGGEYKYLDIETIVNEYNKTASELTDANIPSTEITLFRNSIGQTKEVVVVKINGKQTFELNPYELIIVSLEQPLNEICVDGQCITVEADGSSMHLIECGQEKKTMKSFIKTGHISNALLSIEYIEHLKKVKSSKK